MQRIDEYLKGNAGRFEDDLCELLRIASVSADPARRGEVRRAAEWLAGRLAGLGFSAELIETAGFPLVCAESPRVEAAPTALVYGHYDVQPADVADGWTAPPFEPERRGGHVYARGATDDKGQVLAHVQAAAAWMAVEGRLPINVKFLIEGEEEVGSAGLERILREQPERFACDVIVISDGSQFAPGRPAITYGLRGIAYCELRLTGPNRDLHSGTFGGTVTNPANALARMLAGLVDPRGRVLLPGFYDDVVPLSDREREELRRLEFDERAYFAQLGVETGTGEEGFSVLERRWARPTFDLCGLWGGYQAEKAKTIIPAAAGAKLSFRLVPHQRPEAVTEALRRRLEELLPPGIRMELIDVHRSPGVVVPLESPFVAAAARAIEHAFGRRPVYTREGGSIPIVAALHEALGVDVLLLGWGQDDDNAHGPDERFALDDYHRGIAASARLWAELAP
jgi:acetylornithine deacetylase/succinyl-diaminopimelate desuccinylase-like protein